MDSGKKVIAGIIAGTVVLLLGGVFLISGKQQPIEQAQENLNTDGAWKKGADNPSVTLIEFGDFQCPACGGYEPAINQLLRENPASLQFAWRHFPLTGHKNARGAAIAAEAAGKQDKFWEMHDKLFAGQGIWSESENPEEIFTGYAKELNLDQEKFVQDMQSEEVQGIVQRDLSLGNQLQIQGTPTFFVNGQRINLTQGPQSLLETVRETISQAGDSGQKEYSALAKLKIYVEGEEYDLTQSKYLSSPSAKLNDNIYLLEGEPNPDLVMKNQDVTLGDLFDSLAIKFTPECLELDTGSKYCNSGQKSLKLYINGEVNGQYQNYRPMDGDIILVTYGDETVDQVNEQIDSF